MSSVKTYERATPKQLVKAISLARKGEISKFPGAVVLSDKQYEELVSKSNAETLVGLTPPVNKDGSLSRRLVYIGKNTERANQIRAILNESGLLSTKDADLLKGIVEFLDKDGWLSQRQIDAIATLEYAIEQAKEPEIYPSGMDNYGSLP